MEQQQLQTQGHAHFICIFLVDGEDEKEYYHGTCEGLYGESEDEYWIGCFKLFHGDCVAILLKLNLSKMCTLIIIKLHATSRVHCALRFRI